MTKPVAPVASQGKPWLWLDLTLIGLCMMSAGLGQSLIFSVVPIMGRDLGLTETQVGSIFGISAIFWMIMSPYWGKLSDRVGPLKILVVGMLGYAVSLSSFVTVFDLGIHETVGASVLYFLLICTRTINGIVGSAIRPAAVGIVANITSLAQRTRSLARVESGFTFGMVFGPVVGSALILISYVLPFYIFSSMAMVLMVIVIFRYRGRIITQSSSSNTTKVKLSWRSALIWPHLIIGIVTGIGNSTFMQTIGYYIHDRLDSLTFAQAIAATSASFAVSAAAAVFSSWVLTARFMHIPTKMMMYIGISAACFGWFTLAYSTGLVQLYTACWLIGMGFGAVRAANQGILSSNVPSNQQASAAGYLGMIVPVGHVITPLATIPLYQINASWPYMVIGSALVMLLIYTFISRTFGFRSS